jgi:HSP20 family protein
VEEEELAVEWSCPDLEEKEKAGFGSGGKMDIFGQFDDMRREMERMFENIQTRTPNEMVREYKTPEGGTVREVGHLCMAIQ